MPYRYHVGTDPSCHLKNLFKKRTGMSMRDFRNSHYLTLVTQKP